MTEENSSVECTCFWLPPEQWDTSYYGIAEPGSQMEPNPECPVHFPNPTVAEGDSAVAAVAHDTELWSNMFEQ